MMSYLKRWRRVRAEAAAIACDSSDDTSESESMQRHGEQSSQELSQCASPIFSNSESDSDDNYIASDYGYDEEPLSSSNSDEDDQTEDRENVTDKLAAWATRYNCTRECTNELLTILREEGTPVPKDSRTLLQTPRHIDAIPKCGGHYIYFGIENGLRKIISNCEEYFNRNQECIQLCVNIDGVPLYKSSSTQFWPILCSFGNFKPFLVALFYGNSKPSSLLEYLEDFLEEVDNLRRDALRWEDITIQVDIKAFICDAPARCFLKCTKGHTGYYACERCTIKGYWTNNRVVLHSANSFSERTDEDFAAYRYQIHQVTRSPLIDHGIKCVSGFCLDYMHLVCLGVVKRLITFLKQGPADCRLSHQNLAEISSNLQSFSGKLPSEFARQPRSIFELERWKATEFRQFLLYTGPVALKKIVSSELYEHFLTLTVAISILLEDNHQKRTSYLDYAKQLLDYFVYQSKALYSESFIVYNVHSLIHLVDDVRRFRCSLNNISAFPYENHLQTIKRLVRNAKNPIAQVTKRLSEQDLTAKIKGEQTDKFPMKISSSRRNRCCLLADESYAFVISVEKNGTFLCDVIPQSRTNNFFTKPCESKLINIVYVQNLRGASRKVVKREEINRKVVCLPYSRGYVLLPLLHGFEIDN